jgi:hypothetical protein
MTTKVRQSIGVGPARLYSSQRLRCLADSNDCNVTAVGLAVINFGVADNGPYLATLHVDVR